MGDLNAASPSTNPKGAYWVEWIASLDLVVHYDGKTPTFQRAGYISLRTINVGQNKLITTLERALRSSPETKTDNYNIIAYADDLTVVVSARSKGELIGWANESLNQILNWMSANQLTIAPQKTEAVIVKGSRNREGISLEIGGAVIIPQKSMKYFGIKLDDKMIFNVHIRHAPAKAEKLASALSRLLPNRYIFNYEPINNNLNQNKELNINLSKM
ncbi:hypothetical protein JTB14_001566 [Gonioctena quinquepunctata]|nr:hypothetical protein JTB14_001566 [Gonioctena quinquepunctata]